MPLPTLHARLLRLSTKFKAQCVSLYLVSKVLWFSHIELCTTTPLPPSSSPIFYQMHESEPFVCELLQSLTDTIKDLEPHHIHLFYDAVGEMISAETDPMWRDQYLKKLMEPPNANWCEHCQICAARFHSWPVAV